MEIQKFIRKQYVYVRSFPGAKVKCIKDYVKPCIRENNPEYEILHARTNELNSERIAKSVMDVGKNTQNNHRTVNISVIFCNENFNNKATEVNKELSQMCKKEKLLFVDHSNTQQTFVGLEDVFKTCLEDVFNTSSA